MQLVDYGDVAHRIGNGAHTYFYLVLFIIVILDVLVGISKAIVLKKVNSTVGIDGLIRKTVILVAPLLLYPLFDLIGAGMVYSGLVVGFIAFEASSVVLNLKALGVPVPDSFINFFDNNELIEKSSKYFTEKKK